VDRTLVARNQNPDKKFENGFVEKEERKKVELKGVIALSYNFSRNVPMERILFTSVLLPIKCSAGTRNRSVCKSRSFSQQPLKLVDIACCNYSSIMSVSYTSFFRKNSH